MKRYQLWSQFVDRKDEWIGGMLHEMQQSFPKLEMHDTLPSSQSKAAKETEIVDIRLEPNGDDSAMFIIDGKDYSCGFDVHHGGIHVANGKDDDSWLVFSGYGDHIFKIRKRSW